MRYVDSVLSVPIDHEPLKSRDSLSLLFFEYLGVKAGGSSA